MRELEKRIEELLPRGRWRIFEAMRYTPLAGGKRLRGRILLSVAEDLGVKGMIDVAAAVEIFHAGTLVHDDMPEVDDAKTRRGRAANHLVFGQGMALLAGDGMFFRAFEIVSRWPKLIGKFSSVALEVLIGEAMDVEMEELERVEEKDIYEMYEKKTGALFGFSFSAPAIEKGMDWRGLDELGRKFGVAFQILDDVKDVVGDPKELGKDTGKDVRKKTLVKIWGIERARREALEEIDSVIDSLKEMGLRGTAELLRSSLETIERG